MKRTIIASSCPAKLMSASDKKKVALDVIQNKTTITDAANDHHISRKFGVPRSAPFS